ncbi:SinR [Afipia sp. P52-10]|uniref:SinR n=1 Tax=Afipia sp. P52-10 TaxID=1429916 RepID=UPI001267CE88|nr:SinR [Afipia sp. P52-10]
MAKFIASYDLHKQRNYEPVWEALENLGATRLLESLWVLSAQLTASQVRDIIKAAADDDDSVAVVELQQGADWACVKAKQDGVAWLRQNIRA